MRRLHSPSGGLTGSIGGSEHFFSTPFFSISMSRCNSFWKLAFRLLGFHKFQRFLGCLGKRAVSIFSIKTAEER